MILFIIFCWKLPPKNIRRQVLWLEKSFSQLMVVFCACACAPGETIRLLLPICLVFLVVACSLVRCSWCRFGFVGNRQTGMKPDYHLLCFDLFGWTLAEDFVFTVPHTSTLSIPITYFSHSIPQSASRYQVFFFGAPAAPKWIFLFKKEIDFIIKKNISIKYLDKEQWN